MVNGHFDRCTDAVACYCEAKRYGLIALISAVLAGIEIAGSAWSGSLALLSDAAHVVMDGAVNALIMIVVLFVRIHRGREIAVRHVGNWSAVLGLAVIAGALIPEAYTRYHAAPPVASLIMFSIALVGLWGNRLQYQLAPEGHTHGERTTAHAARAHIVGDAAQSVVVVLGAPLIAITGEPRVDPVLTLGIVCFLAWRAIDLAIETHRGHTS